MPKRLLLLALLALLLAHPARSQEPEVLSQVAPITVMSFNIRYGSADDGPNSWPRRRNLVTRVLGSHDPEIFGVQECLWAQGEYLRGAFPAYRMTGYGRNDGRQGGEMCAVFVKSDRFQVLDQGVFWLSPTPDTSGSAGWDAALPRIATWVRLKDRLSPADTLLVFNTHFDHRGPQAREQSARLLRRRMAELAGNNPMILMGDFNDAAGPATTSYQILTAPAGGVGSGLIDSWYLASRDQRMHGAGTFHGFSGEATRGRIDWILASPGLSCLDAGIERTGWNDRFPSDHFPVWAIFE